MSGQVTQLNPQATYTMYEHKMDSKMGSEEIRMETSTGTNKTPINIDPTHANLH